MGTGFLGGDKIFSRLVVMFVQLFEYTKAFRRVTFIVHEIYLLKQEKKKKHSSLRI